MATSCIIDDYVARKRASILFTEANFEGVVSAWTQESKMLHDFQGIEVFKGLTKWSDLSPAHFRLLITNAFNSRDKHLDPSKHFVDKEPLIANLYFLVMGLVYCIQTRTGVAVDAIKLQRISELEITMQFGLTMMPEEKKAAPKPGLQVIVDNTDK